MTPIIRALFLAIPSATAVWTVGDDAQTCAVACHGTCNEDSALKTLAGFNSVVANIFPAGSHPCIGTQRGSVTYDPSISDGFCGWDTSGGNFDCGANVPKGTNRLCPCGPAAEVPEDVKEANLKKVNPAAYNTWKSKPAPAPVTPTSAPTVSGGVDTNIGGGGDDYYTIINAASQRVLYASEEGTDNSDGTDNIGVGASTDSTTSPEHGWRVVDAGQMRGRPIFKLVNDGSNRRLYARAGTEGDDFRTGFGATNSEESGEGEGWFLEKVSGDGVDTSFKIVTADSGRYLFAVLDANDMVKCGATTAEFGSNQTSFLWRLRVQSRSLVDKSTIKLYHHSGARGSVGTAAYCEVASIISNVRCMGSGNADDSARFVVNFINKSIPSFSLKSVSTGQYCTSGLTVTCTADDVGEPQTFTMLKAADGSIQLKNGDNSCLPGPTDIFCSRIPPSNSGYFEARCDSGCALVDTLEANGAPAQALQMYDSTLLGKPASTSVAAGCLLGAIAAAALSAFVYRRRHNVNRASELSTEDDAQLLTE